MGYTEHAEEEACHLRNPGKARTGLAGGVVCEASCESACVSCLSLQSPAPWEHGGF